MLRYKRGNRVREDHTVESIIAILSLVTAIGAIWAAVGATRQAQASVRQARVAEQSLEEQIRAFREQNERARLSLEFDLLYRLYDRRGTPHFMGRRRAAAKYLLDNAFGEEGVVEVPYLNSALIEAIGIYETLGEMMRLGVLSARPVWSTFGFQAKAYWSLCKPGIEKMREEWEAPALYEDFEYLCRLGAELDREEGIPDFTQEQLRQLMEEEVKYTTVDIDEEPSTTPQ
jgi:hypothetical protein